MAFVVPIIDVIDDKTMEYYHGNGNYFQVTFLYNSNSACIQDFSQKRARLSKNIICLFLF